MSFPIFNLFARRLALICDVVGWQQLVGHLTRHCWFLILGQGVVGAGAAGFMSLVLGFGSRMRVAGASEEHNAGGVNKPWKRERLRAKSNPNSSCNPEAALSSDEPRASRAVAAAVTQLKKLVQYF